VARKAAEKEKDKKKADDAGTMSVVDHLRELRDRIIWSMMAIAVGAVICFIFFSPIIHLMVQPYRDATGKGLIFTQPLEAFMTRIKVAAYGGFVIASPVVFFHLWRFITPGLNPKEKKYAIPFVASSVVLFVGGSLVAVITFPKALNFLLGVGGKDLDPLLSAGSYLTLVFLMILAFGVKNRRRGCRPSSCRCRGGPTKASSGSRSSTTRHRAECRRARAGLVSTRCRTGRRN
jgi:sec-independent protein translocase protein TatC